MSSCRMYDANSIGKYTIHIPTSVKVSFANLPVSFAVDIADQHRSKIKFRFSMVRYTKVGRTYLSSSSFTFPFLPLPISFLICGVSGAFCNRTFVKIGTFKSIFSKRHRAEFHIAVRLWSNYRLSHEWTAFNAESLCLIQRIIVTLYWERPDHGPRSAIPPTSQIVSYSV